MNNGLKVGRFVLRLLNNDDVWYSQSTLDDLCAFDVRLTGYLWDPISKWVSYD